MSICTNISNKAVYEEKSIHKKRLIHTFSYKHFHAKNINFNLIIIIKNVFTLLTVTKPNYRFKAFFWPPTKLRTPSNYGASNLFFFFIIVS